MLGFKLILGLRFLYDSGAGKIFSQKNAKRGHRIRSTLSDGQLGKTDSSKYINQGWLIKPRDFRPTLILKTKITPKRLDFVSTRLYPKA